MKKEDLIYKWLDHDLSQKELEAFEQPDAFESFEKLDWAASQFKVPNYDVASEWTKLSSSFSSTPKQRKTNWYTYVAGIAAALLIGFFTFNYFGSTTTTIETLAQQQEFNLPDASNVAMNLASNVTYNPNNWDNERSLQLKGEAFFKVAKGEKFTVETSLGSVEVLGTQFNVYNRNNYFMVQCYEGTVRVNHNNNEYILNAGESFNMNTGKTAFNPEQEIPSWKLGKSSFESVPLHVAIKEVEIQHNIILEYPKSYSNSLYTGSISHKNLDLALQAITIPFNLDYSINGKNVMLKQRP